jgi:dephospho-CoA kinase
MPFNKPILVGVTGGIGSGKSMVCKIFNTLGIPIYDADSQAKRLMLHDVDLKKQIIIGFGKESYLKNGNINRDYLAKTVFSNFAKLTELNEKVHPAVAKDFEAWVNKQETRYVIKEAALLIESGSYKHLDKLINVSAPVELRIERVIKRDSFRTQDEILKIISNQLSEEVRNEKADYVIKNDESELLITQVLELHRSLIA